LSAARVSARSAKNYEPRPAPALPDDAHKGDAGRVLCICGSRDMPGAAVLVVRAAQRAGAGLVTLGCTSESLRTIVPIAAPEAILLDLTHAIEAGRKLARDELAARQDHARVVGPGMGRTETTLRWVKTVVEDELRCPLVLDADALNVLEGDLEPLQARKSDLVLTPHPGEAARLLGRKIPSDARGRIETAAEISRRSGGIAVLKGHGTIVADGQRVYVNTTGNPGMATAGAGDVLSGILVAYLAQCVARAESSWTVFDAVAAAVHVHGLAGDLAAERLGRRGVIASDLIEHLPAAQVRFQSSRELH
jgi:NAD(P)H-hydrate epimerase